VPLGRLDNSTLADRAYESIREAIIAGELAPNDKVTERGLAARLAVSATPVREALRRLEQDRLVQRTGPRTVQVADFGDRSTREVVLAEAALRAVAARLAATNATDEQLRQMELTLDAGDAEIDRLADVSARRELEPADIAPLLEITRRFHAELNAGCNNAVVLGLLSTVDAFSLVASRSRVTGELAVDGGHAAEERYRSHRPMFDAVRAGDGALAERLMAEHTNTQELSWL
jgi:DNA-binding GntR family transcriptional regulator